LIATSASAVSVGPCGFDLIDLLFACVLSFGEILIFGHINAHGTS
jgi:hypothetical protein